MSIDDAGQDELTRQLNEVISNEEANTQAEIEEANTQVEIEEANAQAEIERLEKEIGEEKTTEELMEDFLIEIEKTSHKIEKELGISYGINGQTVKIKNDPTVSAIYGKIKELIRNAKELIRNAKTLARPPHSGAQESFRINRSLYTQLVKYITKYNAFIVILLTNYYLTTLPFQELKDRVSSVIKYIYSEKDGMFIIPLDAADYVIDIITGKIPSLLSPLTQVPESAPPAVPSISTPPSQEGLRFGEMERGGETEDIQEVKVSILPATHLRSGVGTADDLKKDQMTPDEISSAVEAIEGIHKQIEEDEKTATKLNPDVLKQIIEDNKLAREKAEAEKPALEPALAPAAAALAPALSPEDEGPKINELTLNGVWVPPNGGNNGYNKCWLNAPLYSILQNENIRKKIKDLAKLPNAGNFVKILNRLIGGDGAVPEEWNQELYLEVIKTIEEVDYKNELWSGLALDHQLPFSVKRGEYYDAGVALAVLKNALKTIGIEIYIIEAFPTGVPTSLCSDWDRHETRDSEREAEKRGAPALEGGIKYKNCVADQGPNKLISLVQSYDINRVDPVTKKAVRGDAGHFRSFIPLLRNNTPFDDKNMNGNYGWVIVDALQEFKPYDQSPVKDSDAHSFYIFLKDDPNIQSGGSPPRRRLRRVRTNKKRTAKKRTLRKRTAKKRTLRKRTARKRTARKITARPLARSETAKKRTAKKRTAKKRR